MAQAIALRKSTVRAGRGGLAASVDLAPQCLAQRFRRGMGRDGGDPCAFRRQANLIRLLGILEAHRADGQVVRLIDEVLTKAERGETFPSPPSKAAR